MLGTPTFPTSTAAPALDLGEPPAKRLVLAGERIEAPLHVEHVERELLHLLQQPRLHLADRDPFRLDLGRRGDVWQVPVLVDVRADLVERLLPLVSHPDWSVRAEAIQTLADRGTAKAVPAILRRLETEQDEFVRTVTLRALERLEG